MYDTSSAGFCSCSWSWITFSIKCPTADSTNHWAQVSLFYNWCGGTYSHCDCDLLQTTLCPIMSPWQVDPDPVSGKLVVPVFVSPFIKMKRIRQSWSWISLVLKFLNPWLVFLLVLSDFCCCVLRHSCSRQGRKGRASQGSLLLLLHSHQWVCAHWRHPQHRLQNENCQTE